MSAVKSNTELFEFLSIFPVKYVPLDDSLSKKKSAVEIDLNIINNFNVLIV